MARPYNSKVIRLRDRFTADIASGLYAAQAVLPTESDLTTRYAVSRVTIRRCLQMLEDQGLVKRIPRRGVVVLPREDAAPAAVPVSVVPAAAPAAAAPPATVPASRRLVIASLLASVPDEGSSRIQQGIESYAASAGLDFRLLSAEDDPERPFAALAHAADLGIDGVIVLPYPGSGHAELINGLASRGFPLVCVERRDRRLAAPAVEPDNRMGAYRAVMHLIDRHRREVHWVGLRSQHQADSDRQAGWMDAMRAAGFTDAIGRCTWLHEMTTDDPAYWRIEDPWRTGYEVALRLLRSCELPVSIACLKDYVAWGVYRAAASLGLVVGRDVLVVGFDDLSFAARLTPPLTTVRQPFEEKGRCAAELLDRLLRGKVRGPVTITLPVELVVRSSS